MNQSLNENDIADMEQQISNLLEELLWVYAQYDYHNQFARPHIPAQPNRMTLREWFAFAAARDAAQELDLDWNKARVDYCAEMERLGDTLGDLLPDAVVLVIPVFRGHHTIWATRSYADVNNAGNMYRFEIHVAAWADTEG